MHVAYARRGYVHWDIRHSHYAIELEAEKNRLPRQYHPSYFGFDEVMKKEKLPTSYHEGALEVLTLAPD